VIGKTLGHYSVLEKLGEGGMGEVYRAHDTRLGRDVAIKIVHPEFVQDPDRAGRFEREAHVLAALNHPNIAQIHGLEESGGTRALVMELVEGPTLAERLDHGPIPLDEARAIARQLADALQVAHEQGIIHRDLKPANIKVRSDGTVKVLDFGLAKALDPAPSGPRGTAMPTITSPAMTRAGVVLGTAAYMSPEQARGLEADRRSDIWAYGCVLFEMLTGKRAFDGDTMSDALAAVLRADVDWTSLPPSTPESVRRLLRRCLERDAKRRLQHIGDARLELDEPDSQPSATATVRRSRGRVWALIGAAGAGAVLAGLAAWLLVPRAAPLQVTRFTVGFPTGATLSTTQVIDLVLSPDGRTLVFASLQSGLLTRRLDTPDFIPVRGAEGATAPFFSPDSKWIGFRAGGKLKKVPTAGGSVTPISDISDRGSATWGDNGSIIASQGGDLYEISDVGGPLKLFLKADTTGPFVQPVWLPGSKVLLFRSGTVPGRIEAIDIPTRTRYPLVEGTTPQIAPTGYLLFARAGSVWAVKLDKRGLAVVGDPVSVLDSAGVSFAQDPVRARSLFSVAANGSLAFIRSNPEAGTLVWIDPKTGVASPALPIRAGFQSPRLSPDGRRVAVSIAGETTLDVWYYELDSGRRGRLTHQGNNRRSVWSPDGNRVAFYSTPTNRTDQDLYVVPLTGGEPTPLLARPGAQFPSSWSRDGIILFDDAEPGAAGRTRDIWSLTIAGHAEKLVATRFYERGAVFSPDGKWIAFVTDESGRAEVLVQPFPGPGQRHPVSANGGLQPMWSRDGREVYFREGDSLMAASLEFDPLRIGSPRKLFDMPAATFNLDPNFADYDVALDGRLIAVRNEQQMTDQIHVVLGWVEELRRAMRQ
jgi:WD40 repeat protein